MFKLSVIIFSLFILLIEIAIVWNWFFKGKKYDERQKMIHNRGYKYAFWTIVVLEAIWFILKGLVNLRIPILQSNATSIYAGITVAFVYNIINHAFFPLKEEEKNNTRLAAWLFIINGLFNIWSDFSGGFSISKINWSFGLNMATNCFWLIVGATILFTLYRDKHEQDQ